MRLPFAIPPRESRGIDVAVFGENSVDLVAVADGFPAANSKQRLESLTRLPGGQMATAAAVCARLGCRTRYIGSFGDDDLAALGRASLTREGVDVSACLTVAGAASRSALVLVDGRTGERSVLWSRDPRLAIRAGQVSSEAVTSARVALLDGSDIEAAVDLCGAARQAGVPVVADLDTVEPGIEALLGSVDVLIASQTFPSRLTGVDDPGRALAALAAACGALMVAMTLGEDGSLALMGGREIRTPAFRVACVDTTGAGDAFHVGFVAGWLREPMADIGELLAYANATAALNCRGRGARGAMPTPSEVEALLTGRRSAG